MAANLAVAPLPAAAIASAAVSTEAPSVSSASISGPFEHARGLSESTVLDYLPPKPGVTIDPDVLAAHSQGYTGQRQTLVVTPQATFDWTHGDHKAIVILAEFSDIPHSGLGQAYYDDKLNYNGTARTSARTFYAQNSLNQFWLYSTVTTWVTLPNTQLYYSTHDQQLVVDAARAANSQVDFTQFDENGDGGIDHLVVIHSGGDTAAGCSPNCIWSHMSGMYSYVYVDGVYLDNYAVVADFGYPNGDSLGPWNHEVGHLTLSLPDLYDVWYNNDGLSVYDTMAAGSWYLNDFSAWSKTFLNWVDPYTPSFNVDPYTIYPPTDTARYNPVKITTNYTNEYFLIEMRWDGDPRYDSGIPYPGLIIYHVDDTVLTKNPIYSNTVEVNTGHKGVDIEEVGTQDLDTYGGSGYSNDVWVSSSAGFNPTSTPNTNLYVNNGNYATGIRIYNISAVLMNGGPHITFSIDTGRVNFGLLGRVIGSPTKEAAPGSSVTYPIEFSTQASTGDTVTLQIEGVNQTQGSIDRTSLVLPPFGAAVVNLTVQVPSGWDAGQPEWVQVRATSLNQPSVSFLVPTVTSAAQTYGVLVTEWSDFYAQPGVDENRSFVVRNLGNGPDNVTVSAYYDPAKILVTVLTQPLIIQRGGSTAVPLQFNVPPTIPYGTRIPVDFNIRHGPTLVPIIDTYTGYVTADRYPLVSVDISSAVTNYLVPGQAKTFNVTVHNLGNFDANFNLSAFTPAGVTATFDLGQLPIVKFSSATVGLTLAAGMDTPALTSGLAFVTAEYEFHEASAVANLSVVVTQRFELVLTGDSAFAARPGTNALFNLVGINLGNGPDTVDLSFQPAFSSWNASLSALSLPLGTTVSNRNQPFQFRVTIPPDAAGNLQQTFAVQIRSQASGLIATLEVTVLVLPVYSFDVSADPAQGAIRGSESASFLITFHNRGNIRDSYSLTLDGLPEGWTTEFAQGGVATVTPKGTAQTTLIVHPSAGAPADRYDFQIFASSEGNLSRPQAISLNVTILANREITLRASSVQGEVRPGATVSITFVVKNLGNVFENLYFEPTGASFASVSVDPLQLALPAFEERVVTVVAVLRNNQPAGPNMLSMSATSTSDPTVTAEHTVQIDVGTVPTPPATTPGFEGFVAVAAVAAVAAVGLGARRRRK
jgi:immune inhibitor A